MMKSLLRVFPKFCISCCLPRARLPPCDKEKNESLLFLSFSFSFFNTTLIDQHVRFQYRLSFLFSASVLKFRMCDWGILLFSHFEPPPLKAGYCSTKQTSFSGEIKLIDCLMSCDFTCHKFQAAKSTSITTRGFGESTKTGPATEANESLQEFAPGGENGRVLITCPSRPKAVC